MFSLYTQLKILLIMGKSMNISKKFKFRSTIIAAIFISILLIGMIPSAPEEGMYPLSEIDGIDLVAAGLQIDPSDIYNPNGVSLVDALVRLPGCTGSFVSNEGLILTNHHCAFGAVSRVSTVENNHLQNGFLAETRADEIPLPNYHIRLIESYEDVSDKILKDIDKISDLTERGKIINERSDNLAKKESDSDNSIEAEVSEMFIGKTYVLFRYKILKDVRLVYVPPVKIGNFGGETDNWVWPRHTGDFSVYRAYVTPDGESSEYSEDNVPYSPKRFIQVSSKGVEEGDFTFILGYPARTFRHRPSQFIRLHQEIRLPYIQDLFSWMIDELTNMSAGNPDLELKYASTIKGFANVEKNYRGKMNGLKKIGLLKQKQAEEIELQKYILETPKLKEHYSNTLSDLQAVYVDRVKIAEANLMLGLSFSQAKSVGALGFIARYTEELSKPEEEREERFQGTELAKRIEEIKNSLPTLNLTFENRLLNKMFTDALSFREGSKIKAFANINTPEEIAKLADAITGSKLLSEEYFSTLADKSLDELQTIDDEGLSIVKKMLEQLDEINGELDRIEGTLNKLLAEYVEVKSAWKMASFVPDANYSMRLTYGYVKGYSPADAVYMSPITTMNGVIEKDNLGLEDYQIPERLRELYDKKDFGQYYNEKLGGVPTAFLYNMDTSGGNSGSPIFNAYGELVGINFDRAFDATINDYAWNDSYSRSIGVDIRYVLWVIEKFAGADYLIKELGVTN